MKRNACPRCGSSGFEHLKTHSYCWECNYTPEGAPAEQKCARSILKSDKKMLAGQTWFGRETVFPSAFKL